MFSLRGRPRLPACLCACLIEFSNWVRAFTDVIGIERVLGEVSHAGDPCRVLVAPHRRQLTPCHTPGGAVTPIATVSRAACSKAEEGHRLLQGHPHPPGEWNADRDPGGPQLPAGCAPGMPGSGHGSGPRVLARGVERSELRGSHIVLLGHRPDRQVAQETNREQSCQDVHGYAVDMVTRNMVRELILAD